MKNEFALPKEFSQSYPEVVIIDSAGKVLYEEKVYRGEGYQELKEMISEIIIPE